MGISFISNRLTLLSLIQPALAATSTRSTLPALEGLLLSLENNILTVCGYDMEKGVKTSAQVFTHEEGSVIINAQKLSAIIKSMPDSDIDFSTDEKNIVRITSGSSDFSIHGITASAFPSLPELGGDSSFQISQSVLKNIILTTHFATAQSDARPILTGELFKIEGGKLTVVALDNMRLALREEEAAIIGNEETYSIIVPGKTLFDFSKILNDSDEMVTVEFTSKYIILKANDIIFFSRLLEGEYFDYKKAIPTQNKIIVKIKTESFIECVSRASLLVDEKLKTPLRLKFEGNSLNINCSTQYGKVSDVIEVEKEGDDIEIGINNKFLLDALRSCDDEEIYFSLSSPHTAMVITPVEKDETGTYLHMILPHRLRD